MAAFGLPVTPATVVLVMAAQGGGRILPLAPASAGLRLAMLSYGFVEVTGRPVDIAAITAFTFGVGAMMARQRTGRRNRDPGPGVRHPVAAPGDRRGARGRGRGRAPPAQPARATG